MENVAEDWRHLSGPSAEWIPILQRLTAAHPDFLVWKHLDRVLNGIGDVDAAAPRHDVNNLSKHFIELAVSKWSPDYIVLCRHVPGKKLHFLFAPQFLPSVPEFDVCWQPSRGASSWASPVHLARLSELSIDGIRRSPSSVEGLIGLVYHGLSRSGRDTLPSDERLLLLDGLAQDQGRLFEAVDLLIPPLARKPIRELLELILEGGWDQRRARHAWRAFFVSSLRDPAHLIPRIVFRLRNRRGGCAMTAMAARGRVVERAEVNQLLQQAHNQGHEVLAFQ